MRDPIMLLLGGSIVLSAIALWIALTRPSRIGAPLVPETSPVRQAAVRRWELAGCTVLAAAGLDVAAVCGFGTSSSAGAGITAESGIAMMVLAVVWSIFRHEVLRYQLRLGSALYGLPWPAEPAQIKAAEFVGVFLRLLLFLLGLVTVLGRLILR